MRERSCQPHCPATWKIGHKADCGERAGRYTGAGSCKFQDGRQGSKISLLWVGKRVGQQAEGGLTQGKSLLEVGGHGFSQWNLALGSGLWIPLPMGRAGRTYDL